MKRNLIMDKDINDIVELIQSRAQSRGLTIDIVSPGPNIILFEDVVAIIDIEETRRYNQEFTVKPWKKYFGSWEKLQGYWSVNLEDIADFIIDLPHSVITDDGSNYY